MASEHTQDVSDDTFAVEVLQSDIPVLVDFWAQWCAPCIQLGPTIEEIAAELSGRLKVCKMDIEQHTAIATEHGIAAIPTLMIFKGGEVVERITGLQTKKNLMSIIEAHV